MFHSLGVSVHADLPLARLSIFPETSVDFILFAVASSVDFFVMCKEKYDYVLM
jgi:hypothetical protein